MTVSDSAHAPVPPMLELRSISKSFGNTRALTEVGLRVESGTVHTVLGENGSGKSTLVKILSGVTIPDSGDIVVDGSAESIRTPKGARRLGIATVYQEVLVAPNRSVRENVLLGTDGYFRKKVRGKARRDAAAAALRAVSDAEFPLDAECGTLNLMQQHQVTIARALTSAPRLLILDESTAALDIVARDRLFAAVRDHVASGGSVIFISHRMDEVLEISDAVTVLRSGSVVATLRRDELSERRLLGLLNPELAHEEDRSK